MKPRTIYRVVLSLIVLSGMHTQGQSNKNPIPVLTNVQKLADGFNFTEGPAVDQEGNIYFTDIPNSRIHKWSIDGKLSTFLEDTGRANGLFFDKDGNLIACAGGTGKLISIEPDGSVSTVVDAHLGKPFNSPNDLWIDPKGGIYFTDPRYGSRDNLPQDGEHVYYLSADRKKVIRVVDDMVRPNGVLGTPDGKLLFVADHGDNKTYVYRIKADGTLFDKRLFADQGSDGMTLDKNGNLYLTDKAVSVYNAQGEKFMIIQVPETPANLCFGGKDKNILFITARKSLYSIDMEKWQSKIYSFVMNDIDGNPVSLGEYHGEVVLIVNVASKCGFTKQYAGLQALYEKYQKQGFVILGFPANNFLGQEPGTDDEIKQFCTTEFNVTFPMFSKISVKGKDIHPLYQYLTNPEESGEFGKPITWNFNKFLIDKEGATIGYFGSRVDPLDSEMIDAVEKALKDDL